MTLPFPITQTVQVLRNHWRSLIAATALLSASPLVHAESQPNEFADATDAFIETYCLRCHNESKQKGDFRLDTLTTDFTNPEVAEKWGEVRFRINNAEMPPSEEAQPTPLELGAFTDAITQKIREGAAARMARRGPVQHYRLSRQEYAHTIYDLLGVVYDVEAPGALNEDPRWQGFDRIGAFLSLAPSHIERYFDAADTILSLALPETKRTSKTERLSPKEGKRRLLQLGEGWSFSIKDPGRYQIRIQASGLPAFTGRVPQLSLWHKHHTRSFDGAELVTAEDEPKTLTFEGLFPAGSYEIRNHARTLRHANGAYKLFRNEEIDAAIPLAEYQAKHPSPWTKVVDEAGRPVMPVLLVDWIEVEGPILSESDQAKRQALVPANESDPTEVRHSLQGLAERAWRRPVTAAEIKPYTDFIAAEQEAGEPFQTAYRSALSSLLVSRSFLSLEEGSAEEPRPEVNDYELASRLSFFLWSSMPDEALFEAARQGTLHSKKSLTKQIERMIADPKFHRFLDSFPKQWLQLHRVGMFQPDPDLYPDYDPWLEESMVQETTAYVAEMFLENRPLREIVDSNWTMLNSRLAIHYGLPYPDRRTLSQVALSPESHRGGILTQAAILSLTSDGTRHRPVHRGAWLSEAILAYTPPPPPPNVDPLEPVAEDKPKATIRVQLEQHATDRNCVSCHAKIDPLGLAFENFDAIGRWRDQEHVQGGKGEDPAVDASGTLPNGSSFQNAAEFKRLLAEDSRLPEAFLEQLATYALRRVMTVDDKEQLRTIAKTTAREGHRLKDLIQALATSSLFRQR